MPRKRVVDKVLEELKDFSDEPGHYIVIYTGKPSNSHVYPLLEELFQTLNDGCRPVSRYIIETTKLKTVKAVQLLLTKYGIEHINIYRVEAKII